jgi:hypothetical protein
MNAFGKSLCLGNDAWLAIGHVLEINAPTALTTSGLENNLTCTFMYMCKELPFHLFALHFSFYFKSLASVKNKAVYRAHARLPFDKILFSINL